LLDSPSEVALGQTAAVAPPPAAAVKAVEDQRKLHSPRRETQLSSGPAQPGGR
jgi:hypothetical protein